MKALLLNLKIWLNYFSRDCEQVLLITNIIMILSYTYFNKNLIENLRAL